jgi:hypothetical protein
MCWFLKKRKQKGWFQVSMPSDKTNPATGFTTWLKQQAGRDDAVGGLARDALNDPDWPATGDLDDYDEYLTYADCGAGTAYGTYEGLRQAWSEYQPGTIEAEAALVAKGTQAGRVVDGPRQIRKYR